jgi:hypothetical protein
MANTIIPLLLDRAPEAEQRVRGFIDLARAWFNPMRLKGEIGQTSQTDYTIITENNIIAHQVFGR